MSAIDSVTDDHRPTPETSLPLVSVVMSVYDGERFLAEALDSVLAQTLTDLEIVVVDDGSTDRTGEILVAVNDPRVKVLTQARAGLSIALNRGVAAASSGLIARMDADDVAMPERLEKQRRFMRAHPDVALLGTAVRVVGYAGEELGLFRPPTDHASIQKRLMCANQFVHPAVMFRKEAFDAVGGYRENMPLAQDYDLWLRMVPRFRAANLGEILLVRRVGPDQFGSSRETRQIRWGLKARFDALKRGDYPLRATTSLVRPLVAAGLPGGLRQLGRSLLGRRA